MPINNLGTPQLSAASMTATLQGITAIEAATTTIVVDLNEEDRKKYGSINEQNKLIVNKVQDFRANQAALSSPKVDWVEYQKDYDMRKFYEGAISRLKTIIGKLEDAKILHDYDNYQAALKDYKYSQSELAQGDTDHRDKVNELKQFFNRTGKGGNDGPAQDDHAAEA